MRKNIEVRPTAMPMPREVERPEEKKPEALTKAVKEQVKIVEHTEETRNVWSENTKMGLAKLINQKVFICVTTFPEWGIESSQEEIIYNGKLIEVSGESQGTEIVLELERSRKKIFQVGQIRQFGLAE